MSELEALAWGYGLVEGPRADDTGNVYWSDVHRGGVYCRRTDGSIELAVPKRRGVGGIAFHVAGGLVMSGRNLCHVLDGHTTVLFAPVAPGLNDLIPDGQGRIICGTIRSDPFSAGERVAGECWRVDLDGSAEQLYGDVSLSNGIGFSPDGSVLYHADTAAHGVWAHDYVDGVARNRRFLVQRDDLMPDGMAVDEAGTVWVADVSGSSAVRAFAPDGTELTRIEVPARMVTSVSFGGADRRDLYIATGDNTAQPEREGTLFRTRAEVAGCPIPPVAVRAPEA